MSADDGKTFSKLPIPAIDKRCGMAPDEDMPTTSLLLGWEVTEGDAIVDYGEMDFDTEDYKLRYWLAD